MQKHSLEIKAYRLKHPLKARAHSMISYLLKKGELQRQPCEICGEVKTQAHHEEYEKPLEIAWLCQPCHVKRHITLADENPEKWGQPNRKAGELAKQKRAARKEPSKRPPGPKYQPAPKRTAHKQQAIALHKAGNSYRKIAAVLTVTAGTVYKWLNSVSYK